MRRCMMAVSYANDNNVLPDALTMAPFISDNGPVLVHAEEGTDRKSRGHHKESSQKKETANI
jgi:hypothetical protein